MGEGVKRVILTVEQLEAMLQHALDEGRAEQPVLRYIVLGWGIMAISGLVVGCVAGWAFL